MMRRLFILLLVATIVMSVSANVFAAESNDQDVNTQAAGFVDVKASHWAKDQIMLAVERGYVSGFPDGTFGPDLKVTRAQFFRMLADALRLPHVEKGDPWYQPYVAALIETGIHKEKDFKDKYDDDLSRLEMVKLAVRAVTPGIDENEHAADDNWIVFRGTELGILAGVGAGKLDLQGTSTRAQAVAIIERILAVNAGKKLSVDKYAMSSAELAWHRTNVFTVMPEFFRTQVPYQVEQNIDPIYLWNVDAMTVATKNGIYKGTMDRIIAIDLADPKDPNLALLGDVSELKWYNGTGTTDGIPRDDKFYVKDEMNSYVLYFDGHIDYNKDETKYAQWAPTYSLSGYTPTDEEREAFRNGKLNKPAAIYKKYFNDIHAIIVPKQHVKYKNISISISTPEYMGQEMAYNIVISAAGPGYPTIQP